MANPLVTQLNEAGRGPAHLILRERIMAGTAPDPLPSEHSYARELGVAQTTIHRAMLSLEREGLIARDGRLRRPRIRHSPSPVQLLGKSLVVITPYRLSGYGKCSNHHHSNHGWIEGITDGAIDTVRRGDLNILILKPEMLATDEALQQLVEIHPEGVVIPEIMYLAREVFDRLVKPLVAAKIPVAAYAAEFLPDQVDCVKSDHEAGSYELTNVLIQKGCKKILRIISPEAQRILWGKERNRGYERALHEAGLEVLPMVMMPRLPVPSNISREDLFEHNARLFVGYIFNIVSKVDAIMVDSDGGVVELERAIQLLGREPGKDILITGYDNYWGDLPKLAFDPIPPVATVDKNNYDAGQELIRLVTERKAGQLPPTPVVRVIPHKLITPVE